MNGSRAEERGCFFRDALLGQFVIVAVYLKSNAVSSPFRGGHGGRASAHERIENRVTNETEHADEPFGEFDGIGSGMLLCRCSSDAAPDLLEPFFVILDRDHAQNFRGNVGGTVSARLPLHQYEFDVVFYDGVGLVGLPEKR